MGILDFFRRGERQRAAETTSPRALTMAFNSPEFLEFVRNGEPLGIEGAMKNAAVLRCVDLISGTIGSLPFEPVEYLADGTRRIAKEHPVHAVLKRPNDWQTGFEFRQTMQAWLLIWGNAYARPVRLGSRLVGLIPIHPTKVTVFQNPDYSIRYTIAHPNGTETELAPSEVLHLRGLSLDGVEGLSRVKQAADVIDTARNAQLAQNRLLQNGMIGGVAIEHPDKLSPQAFENLSKSLAAKSGPNAAGSAIILEEGMKRSFPPLDATGAQLAEARNAQVEEIARVFGVPRPLMGIEETSWGSGIEQLAMLFVRFGLNPWFRVWELGFERLLGPADRGAIVFDFDERELLRGTLKDQAEFLAKALGAGGHSPWMTQNEARDLTGLGRKQGGDELAAKMGAANEPQVRPETPGGI